MIQKGWVSPFKTFTEIRISKQIEKNKVRDGIQIFWA